MNYEIISSSKVASQGTLSKSLTPLNLKELQWGQTHPQHLGFVGKCTDKSCYKGNITCTDLLMSCL